MEMYRKIALTILFLANMFVLVHSSVPHSVHDGIICFSLDEILHQKNCTEDHGELEACTHHGKLHKHDISESCSSQDVVVRQNNNTHDEILPCSDCLALFFAIYTLNEFFLDYPSFKERVQEKPYINNYTSPYLGYTHSLRAPPASYFLA